MWVIPPPSDLAAMAKFLTEHPDWSPVLDDNGVQTGICTPWMTFDNWPGAWLPTQEDGA